MISKFDKAIAGAVGAAVGVLIGYYLDWPAEVQAACGTVVAGILTYAVPNKAA